MIEDDVRRAAARACVKIGGGRGILDDAARGTQPIAVEVPHELAVTADAEERGSNPEHGRIGRIEEPKGTRKGTRPMREHGLPEDVLAFAISGRGLDRRYIEEGL